MASTGKQLLAFFFLTLLTTPGLVKSFSISQHRSERNTDLAEALAILQRQRRRVGVEDFINSQRLLQDRPLTLEDVSDWLRQSNNENDDDVIQNEDQSSWMSESGRFKDFEPSPSSESYNIPQYGDFSSPTRMKASDNDIDDIFAAEESGDNSGEMEKKKKEEMVNPKGDAQIENENKQNDLAATSEVNGDDAESDVSNDREVLNSLSDDEIRVLMKAVGKLQHRADGLSAKVKKSPEMSDFSMGESVPSNDDDVIISQPATQEELKSVFNEMDASPVSKETILVENKQPGQETPEIIAQEIVSEKLPDESTIIRERELTNLLPEAIENEIQAEQEEEEAEEEAEAAAEEEAAEEVMEAEKLQKAAEAVEDEVAEEIANISKDRLSPELVSKYLLMKQEKLYNNAPQIRQSTAKRTAKRASGFYSTNDNVVNSEDIRSLVGDIDLNNMDTPTLIQAFVVKILSLQDEIDDLRFKNRLEDLENDQLTDALNEATMGQREGSVSNDEWNSLQHAIEIEQALQDLKKKETGVALTTGDVVADDDTSDDLKRKRGEPWKRTYDDSDDNDDVYSGVIASRSSPQDVDIDRNADIERLLKSSYLMKLEGEDNGDEEVEGDAGLDGGNEGDPVASLFLSEADRCPAIQMYNNNCQLADLYNLPVDFEARALCNLHEMCYACGHSLSVSQPQCDLVYRAAVSSLCHQKEGCVAESEIFLRTMKLKTRYIPHVQPACRSRCTAQFMGMF